MELNQVTIEVVENGYSVREWDPKNMATVREWVFENLDSLYKFFNGHLKVPPFED